MGRRADGGDRGLGRRAGSAEPAGQPLRRPRQCLDDDARPRRRGQRRGGAGRGTRDPVGPAVPRHARRGQPTPGRDGRRGVVRRGRPPPASAMRWSGPLESAALLTILRVPARAARETRGVLPWAPLVGLVLGALATGIAVLGARLVSPFTGAVLGVAALAVLTRGLHLDGLADTADGLGPLRGRERALEVMHQSDIGPFGVLTVVLTVLLQVACLTVLLPGQWLAPVTAVVTARLAMARAGLPDTPMAAGSSLGRAVAGTVSPVWLAGCGLGAAVVTGGTAWLLAGPADAARLLAAAAAGLLAAELLRSRATNRLGGVTGDVMGAMGEVAAAATLLVAAAVLP